MSTTMAALTTGNSTRVAEFVRLTTLNHGIIAMSTLPVPLTTVVGKLSSGADDNVSFTALGSLLSVSGLQRDIKSTANDVNITLMGIDPNNMSIVLDAKTKGSKVEVWRGFFDENYNLQTLGGTKQFFKRYTGFVTTFSAGEDYNEGEQLLSVVASLSCSSFRSILETNQSGIRTNETWWKANFAGDTSMSRVKVIENTAYDFGKPPIGGGISDQGSSSSTYVSGSEGGL